MPPDHPRKLVAFGHLGLLPQTINARWNPGCIGGGTIEPRGVVPFRSCMNRYSQRLGGSPKHLSSTQLGGGLRLYKLWLLKSTNLPVSFFYGSQACGLPWLLSRQCVEST